jgi:hypothetical protein
VFPRGKGSSICGCARALFRAVLSLNLKDSLSPDVSLGVQAFDLEGHLSPDVFLGV